MTIEVRTAALNIAATLHKDAALVVEAAKHFAAFLLGDGTDAPKAARGRKAAGEAEGKAQTVTEVAAATAPVAQATTTAAPTPTASVTATAAEPKVVTQPTLQQVADKIIELANSLNDGRNKAVAILTKYGVKKVPELKPENFEAVLKDIATANAPAASDGLV